MIRILRNGEEEVLSRKDIKTNVEDIVKNIIEDVKNGGDAAVLSYCEKFDKAKLSTLEVSEEEIETAFSEVDEEYINILKEAKENIYNFHKHQVRNNFVVNENSGIVLGQKIMPIERVGLYVPGGTASYPSSVLMNCIPAKIAGCPEIIMVSPPNSEGKISSVILAAAKIAGVDKIYKMGGAQAIAALAYGTKTIKKVDKIVGPGNAFVAEAKKQVYGRVNIDMIAGPSEILVIADETCNPKFVAADLLSQAEHDKMASAVLVTNSETLAEQVQNEIELQLKQLPREEIARTSIDNNGKIIIVNNIAEAVEIANEIAPEHLEICVDNPFDYLNDIKNAGSIFLGKNTPEALGDYFAGPNHTLPTSGTARFSSPLSVDDFIKKSSFIYYTGEALEKVNQKIKYFAEKEGLHAHGKSASVRFEVKGNE